MKEAYIKSQADRVPFTLSLDVEVGDVVKFSDDMIGIAGTNGLKDETITIYVGDVVSEIVTKTEDEIKVGDKLFWDNDNRVLTTDDGGDTPNTPAGHAVTPKAQDTAGSVEILLNR